MSASALETGHWQRPRPRYLHVGTGPRTGLPRESALAAPCVFSRAVRPNLAPATLPKDRAARRCLSVWRGAGRSDSTPLTCSVGPYGPTSFFWPLQARRALFAGCESTRAPGQSAVGQGSHTAQRRLLAALKQLATVRKLLVRPPAPIEVATRLMGERRAPGADHGSRGWVLGAGLDN
jgi:hypothetical protein